MVRYSVTALLLFYPRWFAFLFPKWLSSFLCSSFHFFLPLFLVTLVLYFSSIFFSFSISLSFSTEDSISLNTVLLYTISSVISSLIFSSHDLPSCRQLDLTGCSTLFFIYLFITKTTSEILIY